jgi:hypothetical protein
LIGCARASGDRFRLLGIGFWQFSTQDADFARRFDPNPHGLPFDVQDGDDDVVADLYLLARFSCEH